jgi:hypothetical protein
MDCPELECIPPNWNWALATCRDIHGEIQSHPWRQRDILGESQYIHRDIWDIHGYIWDISEMFLDTYMHQNRKFIVRTRNPEPVVVRGR